MPARPSREAARERRALEPAAVSAPSARELALAEQLAATGDILRIVSTMGPGSRVEPILEAIVATAAHLCGAELALAYVRKADGLYHTVAANRADAELVRYAVEHPLSPGQGSLIGRATLEGGPVHVEDWCSPSRTTPTRVPAHRAFPRDGGVPLMRDGLAVGALGLLRSTVSPFSQAQIELVDDVRRPGCDRDRERAPLRRGAGAHARARGSAASTRLRPATCSMS